MLFFVISFSINANIDLHIVQIFSYLYKYNVMIMIFMTFKPISVSPYVL